MLVDLKNTTKKLGVIGDPVSHSLSPLLHNTMLRALDLDYIYMAQPVRLEELPSFVQAAKTLSFAGFNATMPHKEALIELMDGGLDEEAAAYGAVNTVAIENGVCKGYNTDGRGLIRALEDEGFDPQGKRIVVLGAGGAAKAVSLALMRKGAGSVVIFNRTVSKAQSICNKAPLVMRALPFVKNELMEAVSICDLLINCTSMGMSGTMMQFSDFSFLNAVPKNALVLDLIYNPRETALLSEARKRGLRTANGLGMLIYQGVFALEIFTGVLVDGEKMRQLVSKVLTSLV